MRIGGLLPAVVVGLMLAGCAAAPRTFLSNVRVTQTGTPHQYRVEFTITEAAHDGAEKLLRTPVLTVLAGQEGEISMAEDGGPYGLFCKARVKETRDTVEACTRVMLKSKGQETLINAGTLVVTK